MKQHVMDADIINHLMINVCQRDMGRSPVHQCDHCGFYTLCAPNVAPQGIEAIKAQERMIIDRYIDVLRIPTNIVFGT